MGGGGVRLKRGGAERIEILSDTERMEEAEEWPKPVEA